jgi:uncharacterized protein YbjT (DUF2867 family)
MSKILVTGATGTIGKEVVRALRAKNLSVRAGARTPEKLEALKKLGAEVVALDFNDPASVQSAFEGVDRVFLLTPFVESPVELAKGAIAAAKKAGVRFILRMSAAGADPNAPAVLPREHGIIENLVKDSGIPWAVIQPSFFMDNFFNYSGDSIKGQSAVYGASGTGKVAYVSSADVGAVAAEILANPEKHASKSYLITGGEAVTDEQAVRTLSEVLNREIKLVNMPAKDYEAALRSAQLPNWMVENLLFLESMVKAQGWAEATVTTVKDVTGREPERLRSFFERNKSLLS